MASFMASAVNAKVMNIENISSVDLQNKTHGHLPGIIYSI